MSLLPTSEWFVSMKEAGFRIRRPFMQPTEPYSSVRATRYRLVSARVCDCIARNETRNLSMLRATRRAVEGGGT